MPTKTAAKSQTAVSVRKTKNGGNALTDTVQHSITGIANGVGNTVSKIGTMAGNLVGGAAKKPAAKKPAAKKPAAKKK
jgi:hypothetical protein